MAQIWIDGKQWAEEDYLTVNKDLHVKGDFILDGQGAQAYDAILTGSLRVSGTAVVSKLGIGTYHVPAGNTLDVRGTAYMRVQQAQFTGLGTNPGGYTLRMKAGTVMYVDGLGSTVFAMFKGSSQARIGMGRNVYLGSMVDAFHVWSTGAEFRLRQSYGQITRLWVDQAVLNISKGNFGSPFAAAMSITPGSSNKVGLEIYGTKSQSANFFKIYRNSAGSLVLTSGTQYPLHVFGTAYMRQAIGSVQSFSRLGGALFGSFTGALGTTASDIRGRVTSSGELTYPQGAAGMSADYIIFKIGSTYYAKNGETGAINYSGTDAATVIQAAIDALPSGVGKVQLMGGTFDLMATIDPDNYISLAGIGPATILKLCNDISAIQIADKSFVTIRDLDISVFDGQTYPTLYVHATAADIQHCLIDNIRIRNAYADNHQWSVLELEVDGAKGILNNTFRGIKSINFSDKLINLAISNAGGFINSNLFDDMWSYGYRIGIDFTDSLGGLECTLNTFSNIKLESQTYTLDAVKNIWYSGNIFMNCFVWDWGDAISPNYIYSFATGSLGNMVFTTQPALVAVQINDLGLRNAFIGYRSVFKGTASFNHFIGTYSRLVQGGSAKPGSAGYITFGRAFAAPPSAVLTQKDAWTPSIAYGPRIKRITAGSMQAMGSPAGYTWWQAAGSAF